MSCSGRAAAGLCSHSAARPAGGAGALQEGSQAGDLRVAAHSDGGGGQVCQSALQGHQHRGQPRHLVHQGGRHTDRGEADCVTHWGSAHIRGRLGGHGPVHLYSLQHGRLRCQTVIHLSSLSQPLSLSASQPPKLNRLPGSYLRKYFADMLQNFSVLLITGKSRTDIMASQQSRSQ